MPECDGKNQEEDSLKQADSWWFARPCGLATSGASLYSPGVWFADAMAFFSGVTFVLFCFVFRLYAFAEAATLRSIVLRYAGVPIAARVSLFYFFPFLLLFIWRCRFFRAFFSLFLSMESTSYVLSFRVVFFLPCDHGLDF